MPPKLLISSTALLGLLHIFMPGLIWHIHRIVYAIRGIQPHRNGFWDTRRLVEGVLLLLLAVALTALY